MSTLRLLRPAFAALALALAGRAAAQAGLPKESPFLPAGSAGAASAVGEIIEFAAVRTIGSHTDINLYDTQAKKSHWVPVGGSADGMTVVAYDNKRDQVVARIGDAQKLLTLRKAHGVTGPAPIFTAPAPAPAMSFATPPPAPATAPAIQSTGATTISGVTSTVAETPAAAPAPPEKPAMPPAAPLSIARQEEEARMLVSDLLEIGIAQRKAYEEKQKQAADPNAPPPAPPPPPNSGG